MGGYLNVETDHDSVLPAIMILPKIQAPKVRNIPAQGATLGTRGEANKIPEAMGGINALIKIEGMDVR